MTKKIFLIAGEASGDMLGGALMQDLQSLSPETIRFLGIGDNLMEVQGLKTLFPMRDLSVMGLAEVVRHFPLLYKRFNQTIAAIQQEKPDILITIDAPDFGLRVAKKIKRLMPEVKTIHYVAPTVWAWRPGRAEKIARFLDGLLCLFPFEPPYFEKHGLQAVFVGHSLTRIIPHMGKDDEQHFCARHHLDPQKPILCILPGSRVREIESLRHALMASLQKIKQDVPDLQVILPTLPHLKPLLAEFQGLAHVFVPQDQTEKYHAFSSSDVALHASGTVALELTLCGTPMVTIYRFKPLTAFIARLLLKTRYANLVNILLEKEAVPELIQEKMTFEKITYETIKLLTDADAYHQQKQQLAQVAGFLHENAPHKAARFILDFFKY